MKKPKGFEFVSGAGLAWLECRRLTPFPWLLHAFSTRRGGFSRQPAAGLNLAHQDSGRRSSVARNHRWFMEAIGAGRFAPAGLRQIHSAAAYRVEALSPGRLRYRPCGQVSQRPRGSALPCGDVLMTDEPGVLLEVRAADCLPVLLVDPQRRAVAAVHAGWRGALQRVVEKAVGSLRQEFDSDPGRLTATLGPSIRACCYGVGQAVVDSYCGTFVEGERFFRPPPPGDPSEDLAARYPMLFLSSHPPGHGPKPAAVAHLDLVAVARAQLLRAGLRPANIHVAPFCTACRTDLFFSYRREGAGTGRALAAVAIRPDLVRARGAGRRGSRVL